MRRFTLMLIITSTLAAGGCLGSKREVRLLVTREAEGGGREPVRAAQVRGIALDTSPVPLPLSLETVDQFLTAREGLGMTDEQGRATIRVRGASPYLIEVIASPFDEDAGETPTRWVLRPGSEDIEPVGEVTRSVLVRTEQGR